jgi:hypothetical protein
MLRRRQLHLGGLAQGCAPPRGPCPPCPPDVQRRRDASDIALAAPQVRHGPARVIVRPEQQRERTLASELRFGERDRRQPILTHRTQQLKRATGSLL